MYNNPRCKIVKVATSPKVLNCGGVKQECPLSPYLFVMAIKMPAVKNQRIRGLKSKA
jgi:hypothetical protein